MGDWSIVSARVFTGKGTLEDIAKMETLESNIKNALEKALNDKIKTGQF